MGIRIDHELIVCANLSNLSVLPQDPQYIVTEYGIADLRGKSLRERAAALIAIAHPAFRDTLSEAARKVWRLAC